MIESTVCPGLSYLTDGYVNPSSVIINNAIGLSGLSDLISLLKGVAKIEKVYATALQQLTSKSMLGSHRENTLNTALSSVKSSFSNTARQHLTWGLALEEDLIPELKAAYDPMMTTARKLKGCLAQIEKREKDTENEYADKMKSMDMAFMKAVECLGQAERMGMDKEAIWKESEKENGNSRTPSCNNKKIILSPRVKMLKKKKRASSWLLNRTADVKSHGEIKTEAVEAITNAEVLRSESRNLYEKVSELKIHHARQRQLILGEYQVQSEQLSEIINIQLRTLSVHAVNLLSNLQYDLTQIHQDYENISFERDLIQWSYDNPHSALHFDDQASLLYNKGAPSVSFLPPSNLPLTLYDLQQSTLPHGTLPKQHCLGLVATRKHWYGPGYPIVYGKEAMLAVQNAIHFTNQPRMILKRSTSVIQPETISSFCCKSPVSSEEEWEDTRSNVSSPCTSPLSSEENYCDAISF